MSEKKQFYEVYPEYCCLELVRAEQSGFVDEVVSGIYFPNQNESTCKDGVPALKFCPFCGAKITGERTEEGWIWFTTSSPTTLTH